MDFDHFAVIKEKAEFDLANKDEVWPTCWVKKRTGKIIGLAFPFGDDAEKQYNILKLRRAIQKLDATSYLLVLEVWKSSNPNIAPRLSDNREEQIMFVINDGVKEETEFWPISRKEDGSGYFTEPAPNDVDMISGTMANLFDMSDFKTLSYTQKRKIDKAVDKMLKGK
ncbi:MULTISPECIES: hypothetical protein [Vibrio]|uniref:Uncharacterized protein n=1 Tax=Vibrio alginolyticus TaxID=663 RepID=A0A6M4NMV5_VIBAL|nr:MULTISPECIES: hypothetical protein [Vibrio]MBO0138605.1 hypothetical protein [Vibrio sp. Vb2736]MBO0185231.1 hypothetical protein [Vibrio parahaemolyticus]MDG2778415.1 hypothetical protein [Vibrio parahaemolyticus]MDG2783000.1 hypothetical protein [Vibrio parahaemolyticus]MDW2067648.1 hypothetical protein [Vibrio sp. 1579]